MRSTLGDAAIPLALLAALAVVYVLDRGKPVGEEPPVEIVKAPPEPPKPLRLAVTPCKYDDMGKLLERLGEGYSNYASIQLEDLLEPRKLSQFDVIFLTCGPEPAEWFGKPEGEGRRPGVLTAKRKVEITERLRANLRGFVEAGGTLYASDWRFHMVALAFGDYVNEQGLAVGKGPQVVETRVVDSGLRDLLGSDIRLRFDLTGWYAAAFARREVVPLLEGAFDTVDGSRAQAPLLVKFPCGKGTVIFTAFHNEKQNNKMETDLLRYLVFSAVTARAEAQAAQMLIKGGFSPQKKNIFSASPDNPSVTKTYECIKPGPLQFVLSFENRGARLQLSVTDPNGKTYDGDGSSTLTISVPNAAPGTWQYTIKALELPYPDFPFNLTIGQK
jgi:hypothetical protein